MSARAGRFLGLLCAVVLALQATLAFRGAERMSGPPLAADSGPSLAIARDLASGHGLGADAVRRARGVQPLFTLTCAALYRIAGSDPVRPLRLLLLLHWVLHAATAAVLVGIGRAAYRDLATLDRSFEPGDEAAFGWLVAFLYLVAIGTFLQHYDGLETGLSLLLVAAAWRLYQQRAGETMASALALGLVFGLAILARADAVVLVVIVCAGELLRRDFERIDAVRRVAIIGAIAICVASPWWFYNLIGFGSLVPMGAGTRPEHVGAVERLVRVASAWLADAVPWIGAPPVDGVLANLARLSALAAAARGLPRGMREQPWSVTTVIVVRTRRFAGYVLAFTAALAVGYGVVSPSTHLDARRFAALGPCATLAFAFAARRFSRQSGAVAAALALGLVAVVGYAIVGLHRGRSFEPDARRVPSAAVGPYPLASRGIETGLATSGRGRTTLNTRPFPRDNRARARLGEASRRIRNERS